MSCQYSPSVRLGNWREDLIAIEDKIKLFLLRRERGELLVQKTRKLFCNILKEVTLTASDQFVRFGNIAQILCPDLGLTLAGVVGEKEVDEIQHFIEGCLVSCTKLTTPCVRNSWVIESCEEEMPRIGEALRFGQDFRLRTVEYQTSLPLYLECPIPNICSAVGPSGHPFIRLTSKPNRYCRWKALHFEPSVRAETEGAPFSPRCKIVISQSASNKNLSAEHQYWFPTFFGMECQASVHNYLDQSKRPQAENLWMIETEHAADLLERRQ